MAIQAAYVVPHPPLIVPTVGQGQESAISDTIKAYEEVGRRIRDHKPDTLVVISPHAPLYRDAFFVSSSHESSGTMGQFGAPDVAIEMENDLLFQIALCDELGEAGIVCAGSRARAELLDHGSFVPLYFATSLLDSAKLVRIGLSGLSADDHFKVGTLIDRVACDLGRRVVVIASGDLSHKLKSDGPHGFAPEGSQFDKQIMDILTSGDLTRLFTINAKLCKAAAECGLRSFEIMAGALDAYSFTSERLSYEGSLGVGYGVVAFEANARTQDTLAESVDAITAATTRFEKKDIPQDTKKNTEQDTKRNAPKTIYRKRHHTRNNANPMYYVGGDAQCDPYVAVAREAVEAYVCNGCILDPVHDDLTDLLKRRSGVFVTLRKGGKLRGCIGTIYPVQRNVAEEIVANGILAATRDTRFDPVEPCELDYLSYSVDVLSCPQPVYDIRDLDEKRYGVIVSHQGRRGLLLPDLEGIDSVEQQLIAVLRKADIPEDSIGVEVERFEVVRHTEGGEARLV